MGRLNLHQFHELVENANIDIQRGFVTDVLGLVIEGYCPKAQIGAICSIESKDREHSFEAEVVGFRGEKVVLMPLGETKALSVGCRIQLKKKAATYRVGSELIGRVIDGLGRPLDGQPLPVCQTEYLLYSRPINPLKRSRISEPMDIGVRAVNGLITLGQGQRVGVMAGSGVGKSVLMGMISRAAKADVNVIALIGERGREVREFIEENLGKEGMRRSVVIVATSDVPPLIRMRAAFLATTIAEYFRSLKHNVLLMMDSVTRFAMAQREVGLAAGEPPTTKGYPPSVFTMLPKLFERLGNLESGGSITGIYTVLTEGDEINDPIGDAVRSIVDGHIVLSRKLAAKNHYPAIDVLNSTSRVMPSVVSADQMKFAAKVRSVMAAYEEAEDLINIGAYVRGSNKSIDEAIQLIEPVRRFLRQPAAERVAFDQSANELQAIFAGAAQ